MPTSLKPPVHPILSTLSKASFVVDVLTNNKNLKLHTDKVMEEADWERHRQAFHRHCLQPRALAKALLGYTSVLVWVGLLSVAVGLYDITLVKWYRWPMLSVEAVETFFSSITFALTLLLVFKNNSSYARWWEARIRVGMLASTAHDLARAAVAYTPSHQPHLMQAMVRWTAATMWVVKSMVRPTSSLEEELKGVLLPEELAWLLAQHHKPLAAGQALSTIVQAVETDSTVRTRFDRLISIYTYEFGACNRIYNTAIPAAYTMHTSRFLLCYIHCLPLLLWPLAEWGSPMLAVMISFLLLGIEGISSYIEEPFHVIAFEEFAAAVLQDVQGVLGMHHSSCNSSPDRSSAGISNVPVIAGLNAPAPSEPQQAKALPQLPRPGPRSEITGSCSLPDATILISADASSSAADVACGM